MSWREMALIQWCTIIQQSSEWYQRGYYASCFTSCYMRGESGRLWVCMQMKSNPMNADFFFSPCEAAHQNCESFQSWFRYNNFLRRSEVALLVFTAPACLRGFNKSHSERCQQAFKINCLENTGHAFALQSKGRGRIKHRPPSSVFGYLLANLKRSLRPYGELKVKLFAFRFCEKIRCDREE